MKYIFVRVIVFNFLFKYDDAHNNTYSTRWINPELKEHRSNISVFSCVYEEYSDSEHFFEFTVKTASILFQTSMKSYGKSH